MTLDNIVSSALTPLYSWSHGYYTPNSKQWRLFPNLSRVHLIGHCLISITTWRTKPFVWEFCRPFQLTMFMMPQISFKKNRPSMTTFATSKFQSFPHPSHILWDLRIPWMFIDMFSRFPHGPNTDGGRSFHDCKLLTGSSSGSEYSHPFSSEIQLVASFYVVI